MRTLTFTIIFLLIVVFTQAAETVAQDNVKADTVNSAVVLNVNDYKPYVDAFNADDEENVKQIYPNDKAWDFLSRNMPL
ncbi:MAG: hypothetical protein LBL62_07665, partial [Planctomycetaceae bacterium]|nr:hypothetical protein [Planctomycetaceae bacterium]